MKFLLNFQDVEFQIKYMPLHGIRGKGRAISGRFPLLFPMSEFKNK